MKAVSNLVLYTTAGCHLCTEAEQMLVSLQTAGQLYFVAVDIAGQEVLAERYGLTIPVVRNPATGAEIHWPFQVEDIAGLLEQPG